ncbi:unnamed protein product [Closterium sp. NIES-53]
MALRAVGAPSNALTGDLNIASPVHSRLSRHLRHSHLENAASFICGLSSLSVAHPIRGQPMRSRRGSRRDANKGGMVPIRALDAAQPFDYEHRQKRQLEEKGRLNIGILGFGNFGQFLARRFARNGHRLTAWSRSDYSQVAKQMGVRFFTDMDDFCEEHPDVVLLCTSIISSDSLLRSLPLQRLKRNTLFVDVLSVKVFPKMLLLQVLPPEFDILCTHPMFGPESGKGSWEGLSFVFDRVRITPGERAEKADRFLQIFHGEGCRMVEMTCEEHDKYAAGTQFITHTVGRVLGKLGLESTPINTKGYETLLNLVENTAGDSFDLYYGLFMYNTNATEEVVRCSVVEYCVFPLAASTAVFATRTKSLLHNSLAPCTIGPLLFPSLRSIVLLSPCSLPSSTPPSASVFSRLKVKAFVCSQSPFLADNSLGTSRCRTRYSSCRAKRNKLMDSLDHNILVDILTRARLEPLDLCRLSTLGRKWRAACRAPSLWRRLRADGEAGRALTLTGAPTTPGRLGTQITRIALFSISLML